MKKKIIKFIIIFITLISVISLYGIFFGAKGLKIKEYKIVNKNLPNDFYGLKIVHISDIHYGTSYTKKELEKAITVINNINPDIVVLTGDLLDNKTVKEKETELIELLSKIKVNIKKYAIKGNHDYEYKNWDNIITKSNFINLNDTFDIIYSKNSKILISGISTNLYGKTTISDKIKTTKEYLETNKVNYKILLIHEPDFIDKLENKQFDLILAGHSHNGQVRLPIIGAVATPPGSKKYYKDFYKTKKGDLYISSGLGTSVVPIRLFNKPSFNFYRLTNK